MEEPIALFLDALASAIAAIDSEPDPQTITSGAFLVLLGRALDLRVASEKPDPTIVKDLHRMAAKLTQAVATYHCEFPPEPSKQEQ